MNTKTIETSDQRLTLFRDAVPGVAGVEVVDRGGSFIGRFAVYKMMKVGEQTRRARPPPVCSSYLFAGLLNYLII
jgi:hypothetical protein